MPRTESVISPPIRGAARTIDMAFPDMKIEAPGNTALGGNWINRQGMTQFSYGTYTGFGVPPAGTGWTVYRGRCAHRQTGNGVSGGFYNTAGGQFMVNFPQERLIAAQNLDLCCWRVVAILAFDQGIGSGDTGLEVSFAGFNYDILTGPLSLGFRFGPGSDTSAVFQVRQATGGAFTVNETVASDIDIRDWHAYELRFIGATQTRDGVVKVFFNNRPIVTVANLSWGAGTLLPQFNSGASAGYAIGIGNRGANGTYVCKVGLQLSAASTEAGLL